MEIAKTYSPQGIEDKWYKHWMDQGFFRSVPDEREPYCIVIPPPNVTGVLHMGHMLNNTIQDVLVRRARMLGKNALWVPGTDHASIATEAKVVAMLKEKGIKKSDLTRDEFLGYAWEWKEKYGGIILDQLKKLGASCDWERTRFTMEDSLSEAVIDVFIDLHKKGHIYRGTRMVNWDPQGLTAISDEEVNYKEVRSKLTYIRYQIEDDIDTYITIATTRPETILGDTAICVHPDDERYKLLIGKKAIIPLAGRAIPIIADEYVTMDFGTGALKVTPAHDLNDYELGLKHKLPSIDILNPNGTLSEAAGLYVGEDRFVVRKKISAELEAGGFIDKVEEINNKVGYSERTDAVIEPRISQQWFLNMQGLAKPALENVMNDTIRLVPDKFKNTYRHWMENVHDWCISRQLWWGQRIPAWYLPDGSFVVAKTAKEAEKLAQEKTGDNSLKAEQLRQDEDVLDTWFSSWLWPISVFDGFKDPDNADIKYYYPTNDLVTAPEILFFWVARMIMAGYEYRGAMPFSHVYLTGIVRDKQGRKMSKSLGNSPEPLELIEKFGADGVRVGMLLCSPAGNDILFDESSCEQGRNFSNKIWNAFRLIQGWEIVDEPADAASKAAIAWFDAKWKAEIEIINDHFNKYRISDALMATYKLIWDDFCAWYLEMVKPAFGSPASREVVAASTEFFSVLMRILHPFSPFISEEIWHLIKERSDKDCIIVGEWPKATGYDSDLLTQFRFAEGIISGIRAIRNEKGISPKESLKAYVNLGSEAGLGAFEPVITKLANLSELKIQNDKVEGAYVFLLGTAEVSVPLEGFIDAASEKVRIEKDLEYNRGFLKSVTAKLSNERFVNNAKADVVDAERKKAADAEARIQSLEQQLAGLN